MLPSALFYDDLVIPRRRLLLASSHAALSGCRTGQETVIAVVPKATAHLFFVSIHAGVDAAAREFRVKTLWNGPNEETDHSRQIQIVDAMIARKVDALAISATDERALAAPVERAIRAGIPVTIFDSGVNVTGYVSFIATDNYAAGCTAARRLAALVGATGKVGMVMHKPGGTSTVLREQGFGSTLSKEFPKMTIAARQFGMADPARSRTAAENILTAQPNLAGIFASSEASSLGAMQAIRSRGLSGKVRLITFDTSDEHISALKDGTIDLMLVQDSFRIGYEAVRSLTVKLAGSAPVARMDIPAQEITRANVDDPAIKTIVSPRKA